MATAVISMLPVFHHLSVENEKLIHIKIYQDISANIKFKNHSLSLQASTYAKTSSLQQVEMSIIYRTLLEFKY
jgi:hypothetical protein